MQDIGGKRQTHSLFFRDKTWADSNLTFWTSWQGPVLQGVMDALNGASRLITSIVHIGSKEGFLPWTNDLRKFL
jgi:hypothetical protein